ncbi:DUF305 domain-containing protein [Adhaeribacter radiodurans]|uniref:DUF305 domain-containing protein n=1 Tax=Adhaeribacter radiodurans TaxID=2745197 RepID=A0A7L7LDJ1_9BACT|nr:DUF305 domain-containing protein [Adhaeribacter radiodurans]QMU30916.1 DUF305 domain-containing protein [Adhaeribacter radiodurans]
MKKVFLLAGFASIVLACNTNSNTSSAGQDTLNHAAHNESNSNTQNQNKMNPITATMDKMMHDMHAAKPTGNNDIDFAAMMLEHHKGAVEMSKVVVDKGSNAELKAFAQKVIDDQNKEIGLMHDFISKVEKTASSNSEEFQKALTHSMMAMMNDNTIIYNDIDKDFAAQMIPHHQSAVDMAKAYLEYGHEKSLTTLCENIISSQAKEIDWLKQWLKNKII